MIFLTFMSVASTDTDAIRTKLDFKVYEWSTFKLSEFNLPSDCKVSIDGNAVLRQIDSIVQILPLDSTEFSLSIKTNDKEIKVSFNAKSNEHFNPHWKKLDQNQQPALKKEEIEAYKNYIQFKLLNTAFPDINLLTADGNSINSNSFKGKVTFLNFWYYGCRPCMAEMPALNKLNNYYENDERVQLFSMFRDSIKYSDGNAKWLYETKAYSTNDNEKYKMVECNLSPIPNCRRIEKLLNIDGFPTSMIIDEKGIIRFIQVGANSEGDNLGLIEMYIKKIDEIKN